MSNPLVEHLRESADATVGGPLARLRRLASREYWKNAHLRVRQRPVMRVCLGLLVAFVCGVGLGVGVAAMIAPEPAAYAVAANARPGAKTQPPVDPVIAVSVREEEPGSALKKLPSLIDIDPITENGTEPTAPLPAKPNEQSATVIGVSTPQSAPVEPPPALVETTSANRGKPSSEDAAPVVEPHVQVPIAGVVSGEPNSASSAPASEPATLAATPASEQNKAERTDDSAHDSSLGRPADNSADSPAVDVVAAPVGDSIAQAAGETVSSGSSGVSFEGARSVEDAAQAAAVPRAMVALGPPGLHAAARTTAARAESGDAVPGVTDGETPQSDQSVDRGDLREVQLPPHPPAKNLQLAALPMPRSDSWIRNSVAVPDKPRDAMIAVIIDDMGIDQKRSKAVIDLPAPLTLSFIPYGYNLQKLVAASRAAGHEIMLHQPMEPLDSEADPGPNALRTTVSLEENRRRLLWSFTRLDGIVGLNNHMGSRFTTWKEGMEMVLEEVQDRGLLFVDSFTNNESVGFRLALDHKLPSASRDVFIDHDITQEAIGKSLQELEKVARRKGYAVGIAHPHDLTREALQAWMIDAMARGFDFVPISYIVRRRMKSG